MIVAYLLCLFTLLLTPLFFPHLHLCPFAPFLALLILRKPFLKAIWLAIGAGITLDLLSSNFRFGLYGVACALTTCALFKLKNLFFEERPHALAFFSAIASALFSTIELLLLSLYGHPPPFSAKTLALDLIVMPLFDGFLAFFWFCLPLKLYTSARTGKFTRLLRRR